MPYIIEYYYDGLKDNSKTELVMGNEEDVINETSASTFIANNLENGYKFYSIVNEITLTDTGDDNIQTLQICYITDNDNKYRLEFYYLNDDDNEIIDILKTKVIPISINTQINQNDIQNYIDENIISNYKFDRFSKNGNIVKIYYTNIYSYKIEFYYDGVKDNSRTLTYTAKYGFLVNFNDPDLEEIYRLDINHQTEEKETIESVIELNKKNGYKLLTIDSEILEDEEFGGVVNIPVEIKNDEEIIKIIYVQDIAGYTELFYYNNNLDYSKTKRVNASLGSEITYNTIENDILANNKEGYNYDLENNEIIPIDPDDPEQTIVYPTVGENTFIKLHYIGIEQRYRIDYYKNENGNQKKTKMDVSDEVIGHFEETITFEDIEEYIMERKPNNYRLAKEEDFTDDDKITILGGYDWTNTEFNGVTNLPLIISLNDNENTINDENVINVYFTGGYSVNYRVEYYITEGGVTFATGNTTINTGMFGENINNHSFMNIPGYKLEYASNYPLVLKDAIDDESGDNIIKAYYVKDITTGYRIEYYYDGIIDKTKTEQIEKSNNTVVDTLEYDKCKEGYTKIEEDSLPITIVRRKIKTLKVYYVTAVDSGYKLEFYYNNSIDYSKSTLIEADIGDTINASDVMDNIQSTSYSIAVQEGGEDVVKFTYSNNNFTDVELISISNNINNNVIKVFIDDIARYTIEYYYNNELKQENTYYANIGDEISIQEEEINGNTVYTIGEDTFLENVTYNGIEYSFYDTSDLPIIIAKNLSNIIKVYYRSENYIENDTYTLEYYYNGEINGSLSEEINDSELVSQINNASTEEALRNLLSSYTPDNETINRDNYNLYKVIKNSENATIYICYLPEVETGYKIEFYYQKPRTMINEIDYTKTKYISKTGEINEDDDEIFDAQIDGIKENYVFDHMNTQGNFPFTANTPESHVVKLYYNYDNNGTTYIINYYYNGVKGNTENITENELTVEIINNKIISHRNYNGKVYNYTPIVEDDLLALDSENNIIDVYYTRDIDNGYRLRFYYYDYITSEYVENQQLQETYEANINTTITYDDIEELVENNAIAGYYYYSSSNLPCVIDNSIKDIEIYYMLDIAEGYTIDFYNNEILVKTEITNLNDSPYEIDDEIDLSDATLQQIIQNNTETGYRFSSLVPYPFTITENFVDNRLKIYYVSGNQIPSGEQIRYKVEYYFDGIRDNSKTEVVVGRIGDEITTYRDYLTEDFYLDREENLPLILSSGDETNNVVKIYYRAKSGGSGELEGNSSYTIKYFYTDDRFWFANYTVANELTENLAIDAGTRITQEMIQGKIDNNLIYNGKIYNHQKSDNLPLVVNENEDRNIINIYYKWTGRYENSGGENDNYNYTIEYYYEAEVDGEETFILGDFESIENTEKTEIKLEDIQGRVNNHIVYTGDDENIEGKSYELLRIEYVPYELSNDESLNCIEVYYIQTNKKELNYKVLYYLEGALLETNITRKIVDKNESDEIDVDVDSINVTDKYDGYVCTSVKPDPIPNKVMTGSSIEVHYASISTKTIGYDIKYYLNGELQEDDIDRVRITVLSTDSDEISGVLSRVNVVDKYDGYVCIGTNPSTLTDIAHDGDVIEIYYGAANTKMIGYDVEYYIDEVLNDVVQVRIQVEINSTQTEIDVSDEMVNTIDKYNEYRRNAKITILKSGRSDSMIMNHSGGRRPTERGRR